MADTITVKSGRKDNRVAHFEQDAAHPNGEVFITRASGAVKVAPTAAVKRKLKDGELVEVTQIAPAGKKQTPPTQTTPQPLAGLSLTAEQQAALVAAGYGDRDALAAATDDDLIAVTTIGKATVESLRAALAAPAA